MGSNKINARNVVFTLGEILISEAYLCPYKAPNCLAESHRNTHGSQTPEIRS